MLDKSKPNENQKKQSEKKPISESDSKTYIPLEEIITTNSSDYIKDLIIQIKTITTFFNKIDSSSQHVFCQLNKEYEFTYQKVKNKLISLTKKLCLLTWKENFEINVDSYDDLVNHVEDLLEMVSRNIDIVKGRVKENPEEDITKEVIKIKKEELKNYNVTKKVNLENDVKDIDNSYYPFIPKLEEKPNAIKPLDEEILDARKLREENKEKLKLKFEDSKNKEIQKAIFFNPYRPEIENFFKNKEKELTDLEEKYSELKENNDNNDGNNMMEEEDSENNNDIIKFIEVNSLEEKNKKIQELKYKDFSFFITSFKQEKDTKLLFIDTKELFDEFINELSKYDEIAVDLEHHSKESYLGITCLIQISTRDTDYILDAIKLRSCLNKLNIVFTNPNILKVFHGADYDINWLQRDFGVYVVNMFDTGRASRILHYESYSLKYLLLKFCEFETDKSYQLADWRVRPLTEGMIKYARSDTHFLLYIYDNLKKELISKSLENGDGGIFIFYKMCLKQSSEICLQSYQKPKVKDETYYHLIQINGNKPKKELGIIKETYIFRDFLGRVLDRDPKEILKKAMIFKLSKNNEFTIDKLLTIISYDTPFLRYLNEYIDIINEKIKRMEKKIENSFQEIKKRDEAEYIKRVQKILEKSKMEEESNLISNKKIFLSEEKIKKADEQIKKISNEIKINEINPNINTLFLTSTEKDRGNNAFNKNIINNNTNNILQNFNLVEFLHKKHNISQIKISSSHTPKEEEKINVLNKKRELRDDKNIFDKISKDMQDITNNNLIFSQLKENYQDTKNKIVSESEDESDESEEFDTNKKKKETKIQKKIREKEEKLKKFIRNNKESKYENERNFKYKGKKRK
jgi:exosome complex exonuclease RRP6